jgi:hypothetical protein
VARLSLVVVLTAIVCGCSRPMASESTSAVARDSRGDGARLVSAFFGLDDALPRKANLLCAGAAGQDGMPVILSHTIDERTLQKEDFLVVTRSGVEHTPFCVTLAPAVGAGELRTVLLVGALGSASDPPVAVRIVGDILSDGATGGPVSFRGTEVNVTPLERGPTLVWAEEVTEAQWSARGAWTQTACPAGTRQVIRAIWAGGVRLPSGEEVGGTERALYRVRLQRPDGSRSDVVPFALADLDDNDNNHSLCLNVADKAVSVSFPAGHVVDPNGDLNPATEVAVARMDAKELR